MKPRSGIEWLAIVRDLALIIGLPLIVVMASLSYSGPEIEQRLLAERTQRDEKFMTLIRRIDRIDDRIKVLEKRITELEKK